MFKVMKFRDIIEMNAALNGGLVGGRVRPDGWPGLVGLTVTFATPAVTHTFVAGASPDVLLYREVKEQLETASGGALKVSTMSGRLLFSEATPTFGVKLDALAEEARLRLGLPLTAFETKVTQPPGSANSPRFVSAYESFDRSQVLVTWED